MVDSIILLLVLFAQSVFSTGHFTNPTGVDGQNTYNLGDQVTITWTDTSDYNLLSLGVFSTTNNTVSWLIENNPEQITSYTWIVNVDSLGFDLSSSRQFQFYIVNGTQYGAPFESTVFDIQGSPSVTYETLTATATASGSAATVVVTVTATPPSNITYAKGVGESGYSVGGRVGFIVGLVGGFLLIFGVAAFFYRRRYGKRSDRARDAANSNENPPSTADVQASGAVPPEPEMSQQHQVIEFYSVKAPEPETRQEQPVTEYYSVKAPASDTIQPAPSVAGPSGQQQTFK